MLDGNAFRPAARRQRGPELVRVISIWNLAAVMIISVLASLSLSLPKTLAEREFVYYYYSSSSQGCSVCCAQSPIDKPSPGISIYRKAVGGDRGREARLLISIFKKCQTNATGNNYSSCHRLASFWDCDILEAEKSSPPWLQTSTGPIRSELLLRAAP